MKTNPPSKLAKKLISLSEADNWEEAKNEWKMERYYHISEHCSCLCCSKGVHDMTVIENIFNTNQMHICNSCASLYFGIQESLKIESTVRRLKKNKDLNMDDICLAYLFRNKFICMEMEFLVFLNLKTMSLSGHPEKMRLVFFTDKESTRELYILQISQINLFLKRLKFSLRGVRRWKTHIVFLYLLKNGRS